MEEVFYHKALSMLQIGTTKNEFAANYANASNEVKGSAKWNSIFNEGQNVFSKYLDIVDTNETIDENEYKMFKYVVDYIKNLKPLVKETSLTEPIFKGHSQASSGTLIARNSDFVGDEGLKNRDETKGLKPIEQMSIEEIKQELTEYNINFENLDEIDLRNLITSTRNFIIKHDKNSEKVDFHVGTFAQNGQGSCSILAQIASLGDEQLREMIHINDNGDYEVTFPMDKNDPSKTVTVKKENLESGKLELEIEDEDGNTRTVSVGAFSEGDLDVTLIEMAYTLRFGYNSLVQGESIASASQIFTEPVQGESPHDSFVTEELLKEKLNTGHAITGLKYFATEAESKIGFTEEFQSESGLSAKWELSSSRTSVEKKLKRQFPEIPESKYKDLNEQEFMEFIMLLECPAEERDSEKMKNMTKAELLDYYQKTNGFTYQQVLKLSNGQTIIANHAYQVKSYDESTKEVIIVNPWSNYEDIILPYDLYEHYFLL